MVPLVPDEIFGESYPCMRVSLRLRGIELPLHLHNVVEFKYTLERSRMVFRFRFYALDHWEEPVYRVREVLSVILVERTG